MADTETVYYVGSDPDGLSIPRGDGSWATVVFGDDGAKVSPEIAKSLLTREDFQKNKPTRQEPVVETEKK